VDPLRWNSHPLPDLGGFVVRGYRFVPREDSDGEEGGIDPEPPGRREEFPAHGDRLFLEVISQRPVAEHLEEGQVAFVPHCIDIACPDAFLEIDEPLPARMRFAEDIGDEGMHPRRGEEDRRIVFWNEGFPRNNGVIFSLEKPEICAA
jgi:hypothetical protein